MKTFSLPSRWLLFSIIALFAWTFIFCYGILDVNLTRHFIPTLNRPFADLITVTHSVDCVRSGQDPYTYTAFDPWGRRFNYPFVWIRIFDGLGLTSNTTNFIGLSFVPLFYLAIALTIVPRRRLSRLELFAYLLILLSPPVLLLLERANVDIIIFLLLCLFILLAKSNNYFTKTCSYWIVYFATILKVFPVFALSAIALTHPKKREFIAMLIVSACLVLIYVIVNFDALITISENTPRFSAYSYGRNVLAYKILSLWSLERGAYTEMTTTAAFILSILLSLLVGKFYLRFHIQASTNSGFKYSLMFMIGSAIYAGTFFIGNNFDYRLAFLIFTVPWLLQLYYSNRQHKLYFLLLAVSFLAKFWYMFVNNSLWHIGLHDSFVTVLLEQLASWLLLILILIPMFQIVLLQDYRFKTKSYGKQTVSMKELI